MPFLMGSPFPTSGFNYALDVDFTTFTAGFHNASSFQSQMGGRYPNLTLIRCYTPQNTGSPVGIGLANGPGYNAAYTIGGELAGQGETVQTSPSSLLRSSSTTQTNVACIGNITTDPTKRGLVIQAPYANLLRPASTSPNLVYRNIFAAGGWSNGNAYTTGSTWSANTASDSPDGSGSGCTSVSAVSPLVVGQAGAIGPWIDPLGTSFVDEGSFTLWCKSSSSRSAWETPGGSELYAGGSGGGVWERVALLKAAGFDARYFYSEDARPSGGYSALLDYVHLERGTVPREAIPTVGAVRPGERLTYSNGAQLIAGNGQFKMYVRFSPMFATTQRVCWDILQTASVALGSNAYQAAWYLFSWGATTTPTSYAFISDTDHKLHVKIQGGTEYVSTRSFTWAANDNIEIYLEVGNGLPSTAKWRHVGATYWNDLLLATIPNAPSPGANPIGFLHNLGAPAYNNDTGQFTCRLQHLSVVKVGSIATPLSPPNPMLTESGVTLTSEVPDTLITE